jgi:hypothetical protein
VARIIGRRQCRGEFVEKQCRTKAASLPGRLNERASNVEEGRKKEKRKRQGEREREREREKKTRDNGQRRT